MPKQKTHSGAKKRFKLTKNGIKFKRANRNHGMSSQTSKLKRHRHAMGEVHNEDLLSIGRLLRVVRKRK
jgi:large subunit ribosomal protein L35